MIREGERPNKHLIKVDASSSKPIPLKSAGRRCDPLWSLKKVNQKSRIQHFHSFHLLRTLCIGRRACFIPACTSFLSAGVRSLHAPANFNASSVGVPRARRITASEKLSSERFSAVRRSYASFFREM